MAQNWVSKPLKALKKLVHIWWEEPWLKQLHSIHWLKKWSNQQPAMPGDWRSRSRHMQGGWQQNLGHCWNTKLSGMQKLMTLWDVLVWWQQRKIIETWIQHPWTSAHQIVSKLMQTNYDILASFIWCDFWRCVVSQGVFFVIFHEKVRDPTCPLCVWG